MRKLIIDTSSEQCLLAIAEESTILTHALFLHDNRLSQTLLPSLAVLLQEKGLALQDIASLAVGVGPGSYTGTRVGVTVARTLSFGLNIPLRGFCSLTAFLPQRQGRFVSVFPAKSSNFYLLIGERNAQGICLHSAGLSTAAELCAAASNAAVLTAKRKEELPPECPRHHFIPFHLNAANIALCLQAPPCFAFESEAQLVYL
ncbi:MAG TPA: tRNA (adenosine(37)-N6)-threonylcarbamoyltransferase complex dimerization subunit type 1 TsaB [Rhabdochlamydiaceae bacterium]|jgi:tRNA threonylcarbamoyl adenosine modification protein YeaZ